MLHLYPKIYVLPNSKEIGSEEILNLQLFFLLVRVKNVFPYMKFKNQLAWITSNELFLYPLNHEF